MIFQIKNCDSLYRLSMEGFQKQEKESITNAMKCIMYFQEKELSIMKQGYMISKKEIVFYSRKENDIE